MSRSKRSPYFVEGYGSPDKKIRKRRASRKVRDEEDPANGAYYRRLENPWNICDYRFFDKTGKARRK